MKNTAAHPKIIVSADGTGIVSQAGAVLLTRALRATGLDAGLTAALGRWRPGRAMHDPGKIIADLAVTLALGGDCLADIAMLRAEPSLFGPAASDPVVSRLVTRMATDAPRALKAIRRARAAARERAWALAGDAAPGADGRLITADTDATIVTSCSEKDQATPTWKKTFGFHPLTVFAGHGPEGSGEPLTFLLRPGNAGSNTASEHVDATQLALAQLPRRLRRQVLIRADSGGGTQDFLKWPAKPGRRLAYSVGFTTTEDIQDAILAIPADGWTPAYDADRQVRPGAWVAEITGMPNLSAWPEGMRVIVRKERPHPGAQLRFTDIDGHRFTCLATSTKGGQLADLELRHRRRARCEDRIRCAKDTGLRNLPLHGYAQNKIWCEIVALACDLLAWTQMLALTGAARRREPRRLRLRIFSAAGRIVRGGRRPRLRGRRPMALGRRNHRRNRTAPGPRTRLTSRKYPNDQERTPAGPWNPADPARQPGRNADRPPENGPQPQPQATNPRSRKIEARAMRYLGLDTAKKIPKIGPGTWQFGSRQWGYGERYAGQQAHAIVRRALKLART